VKTIACKSQLAAIPMNELFSFSVSVSFTPAKRNLSLSLTFSILFDPTNFVFTLDKIQLIQCSETNVLLIEKKNSILVKNYNLLFGEKQTYNINSRKEIHF
jgi:hypothetical protein